MARQDTILKAIKELELLVYFAPLLSSEEWHAIEAKLLAMIAKFQYYSKLEKENP